MAEPSIAREGQATPARRVHIVKLPGGWHDHKNYSRAQSSSHVVESTAFCQACRPRAALTEDSPRLYKKAKPPPIDRHPKSRLRTLVPRQGFPSMGGAASIEPWPLSA
jgi:hypothetical protein